MSDSKPSLAWEPLGHGESTDYRIFRVRRDRSRHPRTGEVRTFSVIESADWVNVIALTPADQVVLIQQYRHGTERVTLEIPGGLVEPGEASGAAAARELVEETGYTAPRWVHLGFVEPNPAIQSNRCDTWLALDAARTDATRFDPGELIELDVRALADVPALIRGGAIAHALVVAGFAHLVLAAGGWRRP
jgi:8-oxo-dGTP pyrophosphatase MutT (NUDIX family)